MFRTVIRWHKIFSSENDAAQLPLNRAEIRYIAGRKMCLIRTHAGVFAIEERCPHNGFSLLHGRCTEDGEAIVCPLHRYAFDLKTGRSRSGAGGAAITFPVKIEDDGVFVGVEEREWGWGKSKSE